MPGSFRINNNSLGLNTNTSVLNRQGSNPDFASHMRKAARVGTQVVGDAARFAMPYAPGRALLTAALNSAAGTIASSGDSASSLSSRSVSTALVGEDSDIFSTDGAPDSDFRNSMGDLQSNMRKENIEMLALQKEIQQVNLRYTTASNIMKTDHDTKKNSVTNIR